MKYQYSNMSILLKNKLFLCFTLVLLCIFGCKNFQLPGATNAKDISEISFIGGGPLGSVMVTLKRNGASDIGCVFVIPDEKNVPDFIPDSTCGNLYRSSASFFIKTQNTLTGKFEGNIPKEQFDKLAELIVKNDFFSVKDEYKPEFLVLDGGTISIKVTFTGGVKEVVTWTGGKPPEELEEIMREIITRLDATNWKNSTK